LATFLNKILKFVTYHTFFYRICF